MEAHLRDLFVRFHEQFGSGPSLGPTYGTCLLKAAGVPAPFVRSLFRAAAALHRTDPWRRLRPAHLFGVRVGRDADWPAKKQMFCCAQFIGGDGGDVGVHLFKSENDAVKATDVLETRPVPNAEVLRVVFAPEPLLSPANRRMVTSLALEAAGDGSLPVFDVARFGPSGSIRFRDPTVDELRYAYAFLRAATLVHPLLQAANEGVSKWGRLMSFEPLTETVDVQWPAEVVKGGELVAVTISHQPTQMFEEKRISSSPAKYLEPPKEDHSKMKDIGSPVSLRRCAMCNKSVQRSDTVCCSQCRAIVYCGAMCQKQNWKEAHKAMCGLYQAMMEREDELAFKIFAFQCFVEEPCRWLESQGLHQKGMWRRLCSCYSHCPFGLLPSQASRAVDHWGGLGDLQYPPDSSFQSYNKSLFFLSGWPEYYNLRSLPVSSPVAAILSHPLTVYHVLTTLLISTKNRLTKGKEVVVHYLGPAEELDWMQAFAEIGHLLSGSGNVQIFMIGPDVPSNLSGTVSGITGRLKVSFVRGLYQDQVPYLPAPHAVVALNCGLQGNSSWTGALELMKSMNVPVFFTERSEIACADAKQVLRASGLQVTHPVAPNPFRSPLREQAPSTNLPTFSNGFLFGLNA